jgi:hypothetical protein
VRGTWREGSITGDSVRYVKAVSEGRDLSIGGLLVDQKTEAL